MGGSSFAVRTARWLKINIMPDLDENDRPEEAANDERPALIGENLARCNPDDIPGMRLARGEHIRTLCQ